MPKSKKGPHGKTTSCDLIGCHTPDVDDQVYDKEGTSQCNFGESLADKTDHSSSRLRGSVAKHLEHCVEFLRQSLVGLAGLALEKFIERDGRVDWDGTHVYHNTTIRRRSGLTSSVQCDSSELEL